MTIFRTPDLLRLSSGTRWFHLSILRGDSAPGASIISVKLIRHQVRSLINTTFDVWQKVHHTVTFFTGTVRTGALR